MTATGDEPSRDRPRWWWPAVLAIALAGLVLRLWNVDHDQRQHLHPDERHWALTASSLAEAPAPAPHGTAAGPLLDWLDGQRSPANAYRGADSFVYGPVTLAGTRTVAGWLHDGATDGSQPASAIVRLGDAAGLPLLDDAGAPRFDDRYQIDLIGRILGALADAAAIVVVAAAARRVRGPIAGVAAAAMAAVSVMAIQHAHVFGSEPWLGLASALVLWACLALDRSERVGPALRSGSVLGLATGALLAVKLSGAGLALLPLGSCAWLLATRRRRADLVRLMAFALGTALAFRVLYPSAFDGLGLGVSSQFWEDLRSSQAAAMADAPPAIQWSARIPVLEPLGWLIRFTVGPGAAMAAAVGTWALWRGRQEVGRWAASVAVLGWLVPMVFVFRQAVTTGRYFVPMLPALFVCAGVGVDALVRAARQARADQRIPAARLAGAGATALVAVAVLWGVAFVGGVYGNPHTRLAASAWIGEHVEPGSTLSSEAWDDALPLDVGSVDPTSYESEQLDLFAVDGADKVQALATSLARTDYVVESSPRVWRAVTRIPARYPSTIRFFELLDAGALGFERVATFTSPPRLGPLRLDDAGSEEAFSVYDHPEVRIWEKVRQLDEQELLAQLDPTASDSALRVAPASASANGAMLRPSERAENDRIGTFAEAFDRDGNPLVHAVGWLLVVEVLGLAAFALALPALRGLPDAGAGLAKVVGLVGTAFVVFVAVTWLGLPLTRGLVGVCAVGWVVAGAGAGVRRRADLAEVWRTRRRAILQVEAIALTAFVAVLLLRAANPDLWHVYRGGEKPFELEMFTAVLRTRTLPPYDPWFAGGSLNYYYGGYLLLSVPARILGTPPALAMSLGLGVAALLAAGAVWSAGAALADLAARPRRRQPTHLAGHQARRAGALAVGLVLVLPSAAIVPSIVDRLLGREDGFLDWWGLSRVVPNSPIITEFPAWSFLFGDLHPHVMDLPVLAGVVAVAIALYRSLTVDASSAAALGTAALLGVLVGAVRATNTWDLPLALGLAALAPVVAWGGGAALRRCAAAAVTAAAVVVVGWAPYAWRTEVSDSGVEREVQHTPFGSWLAHHGFLVFATAMVLVAVATRVRWTRRSGLGVAVATASAAVLAIAAPDQAAFVASAWLAGVTAAAAVAGPRRGLGGPLGRAALGALALGWTMVAAIEHVSVVNDFDRQNTVFKGWYQAWLVTALALAVCLAGLAMPGRRLRASLAGLPGRVRAGTYAARAALIGAVLLAVAFVQLAVPARLDDRTSAGGLSLDGLAYLDAGTTAGPGEAPYDPGDDRPLIDWLQEHVRGVATVTEAPGDDYTWSGRIAAHTGLASVLSWPYHQGQQRRAYESEVNDRRADLAALYTSADPVAINRILQAYDVDYVVFGTAEASLPGPDGTVSDAGRTALLRAPCLRVVFEDAPSFIAQVDQACLARQPGGLPAP